MKVLLLDNYDSFTNNLKQMLEESQWCTFDIKKNDQVGLEEIESYDKILISPGPGLPGEAGLLLDIIQNYAKSKSILGVCLGHQAIAEVFGGRLIHLPTVYHGMEEKIKITDQSSILFKTLPDQFDVGLYHSWAVDILCFPNELKITALSSSGVIMSIQHKTFKVYGIQFHPESIMTSLGKIIIRNWLMED